MNCLKKKKEEFAIVQAAAPLEIKSEDWTPLSDLATTSRDETSNNSDERSDLEGGCAQKVDLPVLSFLVEEKEGCSNKYDVLPSGCGVEVGLARENWLNRDYTRNNSDLGSQRLIRCIYKVPEELRTLKNSAYEPRVVSIGPIHSSNYTLPVSDLIKLSYRNSLLSRTAGDKSPTLEGLCRDAMVGLEASVLNCYEGKYTIGGEDHWLAEMMLNDGCFILELLYKYYLETPKSSQINNAEPKKKLVKDDPVFNSPMRLRGIRHDLLLLENQIPFFVLKELFSLTVECIPDRPHNLITDYVLPFFDNILSFAKEKDKLTKMDDTPTYHILHLLHKCYLPSPDLREGEKNHNRFPEGLEGRSAGEEGDPSKTKRSRIRSASDLDLAGVKFIAGTEKDLFNVNFSKLGCPLQWFHFHSARFEIPTLSIYDDTEPLLRNLIAFEQCCPAVPRHITSYCFFMDTLINSAEDVKLLENAEILQNYLGTSKDVSDLFNNICKEAVVGTFYFQKTCDAAGNHCRELWPRFLASLKRDYFANPWSGIAVLAAIIIFGLTIVQTIYTVRSYY